MGFPRPPFAFEVRLVLVPQRLIVTVGNQLLERGLPIVVDERIFCAHRAQAGCLDGGEIRETVTTSEAQVLSGHSAVIWLDGISGCYDLERVTALKAAKV